MLFNTLAFGVVCCMLLVVGCQKKESKTSPRSIYDQSVFVEMALNAVKDDAQFVSFKRNPFFNLLWENLSKEEGEMWLHLINEQYPFLVDKLDRFAESDRIGSPRIYPFGEAGEFSPSTLRFVAIAGQLQSRIGDWSEKHIIQIGAGYGGLCKILHVISGCASYTIIDLPEQLALARKYLESFGLNHVIYSTPDQISYGKTYDLAISDMSFSEFNRAHQELFLDRILLKSKAGFLVGRVFPKHYGVAPLNWDELKRRFEKKGKFSQWEMQEPTIEKENYLICFKRED